VIGVEAHRLPDSLDALFAPAEPGEHLSLLHHDEIVVRIELERSLLVIDRPLEAVMMSSVRPWAKNSCSGSPLMLVKGSTAIAGLSEVPGSPAGCSAGELPAGWLPPAVTLNTRIARAMFLTLRSPRSSNLALYVPVLGHDVTQVYADAELDAPVGRDVCVAPQHSVLNLHRALHGVDDVMELDQHAVAGGLDDLTLVLDDRRIDQLEPVGLEACQRPGLVELHQPAIADHVGGKNGG